MGRSAIPGPLERRHLVEREVPAEKARVIAEAYLELGRTLEAIDFLAKAGAGEGLAELRAGAIQAGDAFLLRAVTRAAGAPARREEWARLAEAAERAGKQRYALDARRQAERGEE